MEIGEYDGQNNNNEISYYYGEGYFSKASRRFYFVEYLENTDMIEKSDGRNEITDVIGGLPPFPMIP